MPGALRQFQRGAVEADPELVGLPELAEGPVEPRALAIVPERLVLVELDQSTGPVRRPVPVVGIVAVHVEELPDRIDGRRHLPGRYGLAQDDVTLGLEVLELVGRQHVPGVHALFVASAVAAFRGPGRGAGLKDGTVVLVTRIDSRSGRTWCSKSP